MSVEKQEEKEKKKKDIVQALEKNMQHLSFYILNPNM